MQETPQPYAIRWDQSRRPPSRRWGGLRSWARYGPLWASALALGTAYGVGWGTRSSGAEAANSQARLSARIFQCASLAAGTTALSMATRFGWKVSKFVSPTLTPPKPMNLAVRVRRRLAIERRCGFNNC